MKPADTPASSAPAYALAFASATIRATNSGGAGLARDRPVIRARRSRPIQASAPGSVSRLLRDGELSSGAADARAVGTGQQGGDRAVAGEYRVRGHVVPGGEHERALVRTRMRQRELRVVTCLAGHGDDVDVERSRSP